MFFSRSADILVPISRFGAQKNCIPPLASHSNSSGFLPDLTLFHFVFAPDFQSFRSLSAPDRRDLRTRTSNLRDQIWASIPLLPGSSVTMISTMISGDQGTPLEMKRATACPAVLFHPEGYPGSPPPFISTRTAPKWRMLLGRLVGLLIYQFGAAAFTYPLPLFLSLTPRSPLLRMIIRCLFETEDP